MISEVNIEKRLIFVVVVFLILSQQRRDAPLC